MSKTQTIGYIRISTEEQNEARQVESIQADRIFTDKASGRNADRPQLQALLEYARSGDKVIVHSLDRLARNLLDLRKIVEALVRKGVTITFLKENLTFSGEDSHMSTLLLSIMGAFAEFELALIKERQKEGIAIAKKKGLYKGGHPKLSVAQMAEARTRLAAGAPKARVARDLHVTRATLYQYLKDPARATA